MTTTYKFPSQASDSYLGAAEPAASAGGSDGYAGDLPLFEAASESYGVEKTELSDAEIAVNVYGADPAASPSVISFKTLEVQAFHRIFF